MCVSMCVNRVAASDWMWLPEQPLAGAHALVAVVSQLQLATVLRTYPNGAIRLQLFDTQAFTFTGPEVRLPPPRTLLEAEQRLLPLTSLRPHWVGRSVSVCACSTSLWYQHASHSTHNTLTSTWSAVAGYKLPSMRAERNCRRQRAGGAALAGHAMSLTESCEAAAGHGLGSTRIAPTAPM